MGSSPPRKVALDTAIAAVEGSKLTGWPLVERAQSVVHRRFHHYSCLFWYESPRVAFARGRGYCVQYNGALFLLLSAMGVECRLVHAFRVYLPNDPHWRMGHVWVQARLDGDTRDVCAGRASNRPGDVSFTPLTAVRPFGAGIRALTGVAMGPLVGAALLRSALTRQPRPDWLYRPMDQA